MAREACHFGKNTVLRSQFFEVQPRPACFLNPVSRFRLRHEHQLLGMWIGKRLQQHRIDDAEDRSVRADTQRERENGHRGKSGTLAQHAQSKSHILPKRFEESDAVHAIYLLSNQSGISQFSFSGAACIVWRHSTRNIFLRFSFDVSCKFARALLIPFCSPKKSRPAHFIPRITSIIRNAMRLKDPRASRAALESSTRAIRPPQESSAPTQM